MRKRGGSAKRSRCERRRFRHLNIVNVERLLAATYSGFAAKEKEDKERKEMRMKATLAVSVVGRVGGGKSEQREIEGNLLG